VKKVTFPDLTPDDVLARSADLVTREIEGEFLMVPIVNTIGEEGELYSLNETGRAIWDRLDGTTSIGDIVNALGREFDASREEVERDVLGILGDLLSRRMVTRVR